MKKELFAFPNAHNTLDAHRGMSLRDYFAGQALISMADAAGGFHSDEKIAQKCYELADAMLAAREEER